MVWRYTIHCTQCNSYYSNSWAFCYGSWCNCNQLCLEVHRIRIRPDIRCFFRIRIRPDTKILGSGKDPNSLDPVNRIHYHVVSITVSKLKICLVYCLLWFDVLWFDVLWFDVLINNNSKHLVAIQLWSGLGYIRIRIRWRSGSGRIRQWWIR